MATSVPLYGWLTAEAVSLTGTRVSMIAVPWFVLTTTGSPAMTGLAAFAEMAPLVLFKAVAGPLVDRIGARRVAVAADVASLVAVALIPLLHAAGALSFPSLLLLVAVAGALRGPGDGAKQAMIPDLVRDADVPLERATGLAGAVERTASMLGAAFAGGLVALLGAGEALLVDAASFLASALLLVATAPRPRRRGPGASAAAPTASASPALEPMAPGSPASYLRRLREGWEYLRTDQLLLGICVMLAVTNLLDQAYAVVLVPVWAQATHSGPGSVGLLFAVFSGASIGGAVLASAYAARLSRYYVYLVGFLVAGLPRFAALALPVPWWAVLATSAVAGFASGFINPVLGAVEFERIPAPLVGRVSSLNTALSWSLIPLGGLLAGALITGVGRSPALLLCGAAYLAVTTLPALQPRWREMDRPAPCATPL